MSFIDTIITTPILSPSDVRRLRRKPHHVQVKDYRNIFPACRCGARMIWKKDRRRKQRGYFVCPEAKKLYDKAYWQRTGSYRRYKRRLNIRIDDKHRKIEIYTKISPQGLVSLENLFKGVTA